MGIEARSNRRKLESVKMWLHALCTSVLAMVKFFRDRTASFAGSISKRSLQQ